MREFSANSFRRFPYSRLNQTLVATSRGTVAPSSTLAVGVSFDMPLEMPAAEPRAVSDVPAPATARVPLSPSPLRDPPPPNVAGQLREPSLSLEGF